jgi:hypothetical protein
VIGLGTGYPYGGPVIFLSKTEHRESHTQFWLENLNEKDHSGNIGIDGRILLKLILEK